jgi:hypothetical protein
MLCLAIFACKSKVNSEIERLVKDWTGKTIVIPEHVKCVHPLRDDTVRYTMDEDIKEYKILFYVDSTGCTHCKLHLHIWKMYIKELSSKVDFKFYFYPKTEEELLFLLNKERFAYPVYIDSNDELNSLNRFPANPAFQCFLLDRNNKILAAGNPAENYKVWELYRKIITGKARDKMPVTTVAFEQTELKMKNLQTGKTSEAVFTLKNTGAQPLIIQMVNASCGCIISEWEKQPIKTGKTSEIKIRITPEEKGYFNKTITVQCNTQEGQILLKVNGTVTDSEIP